MRWSATLLSAVALAGLTAVAPPVRAQETVEATAGGGARAPGGSPHGAGGEGEGEQALNVPPQVGAPVTEAPAKDAGAGGATAAGDAGVGGEEFAVDLLDLEAVRRRVEALGTEVAQLREGLGVVRGRLERVREEVAAPEPPAALAGDDLGDAPQPMSLDELLGGTAGPPTAGELKRAEAERKARHAEAMAAWERRKAERAQAVAAHAEATRAHGVALAEWEIQTAARRDQLAKEADEVQVRLDDASRRRRRLRTIEEFLDKSPPAARTALRSLRATGEKERARVTGIEALGAPIQELRKRLATLAEQASSGGIVGLRVDIDGIERRARGAAEAADERRQSLAKLAVQLTELADRLDRRWDRLRREVLLVLGTPGQQERIDGLYSARVEAERRGRRALGSRPPAEGPPAEAVGEAVAKALPRPGQVSSVSDGRTGLSGADRALDLVQSHVDEQGLALAWRELAFDRQYTAALAPHISESLRDELHGFGLSIRWLSDARLELLEAKDGIIDWAQARWKVVRGPDRPEGWLGGLVWVVSCFLLFWLMLRFRAALKTGLRALVRVVVIAPIARRTAGAAVRWGVLAEAVIGPAWTLAAGLIAFELMDRALPELFALRAAFVWWMSYRLVAQTIVGLTARAGPGRPPLLPADAETTALLELTWQRIGLPVVITGFVDEVARAWLLGGVVSAIFRSALWILLAGWALWSLVAWRPRLANWWLACTPDGGLEDRLAKWYAGSAVGALLSPAVMLRLLLDSTWRWVRAMLSAGGALAWLQSRRLKREARNLAPEPGEQRSMTVPATYRETFGADVDIQSDGALPRSRAKTLEGILEVVSRWEREPGAGAVVLTAESGMGKSVVLDQLELAVRERVPVARARLTEKILRPADLAAVIAPTIPDLGEELASSGVDALAAALDDGAPRIIIVDDVHHLFLRTVGGYEAFDALVRLVVASGDGTFWVLAVGQYAWSFLSRRRRAEHHFDDVHSLPPLDATELESLITRRHATTGFELEFDEVIHSGGGASQVAGEGAEAGLRLVESVDGFFLLLADASGGNPDIAQRLWLDSLTPGVNGALRVGVFPSPDVERLKELGEHAFFALAAFVVHETLTTEELATVTNVHRGEAEANVERLRARGVICQKAEEPRGRLTVSPRWYRPAVRLLRRKQLL